MKHKYNIYQILATVLVLTSMTIYLITEYSIDKSTKEKCDYIDSIYKTDSTMNSIELYNHLNN